MASVSKTAANFCSLFLSLIVEITVRQRSAHGRRILIKQYLEIAVHRSLHISAGDIRNVAIRQSLFCNGSLDDVKLFNQLRCVGIVLVYILGRGLIFLQEIRNRLRMLLCGNMPLRRA